jgi:hypothetical protein
MLRPVEGSAADRTVEFLAISALTAVDQSPDGTAVEDRKFGSSPPADATVIPRAVRRKRSSSCATGESAGCPHAAPTRTIPTSKMNPPFRIELPSSVVSKRRHAGGSGGCPDGGSWYFEPC